MGRAAMGILLGLGMVVGLLAGACTASTPAGSSSAGDVRVSRPGSGTPGAMFTPTGQVRGARATPGITGTPTAADIQATLRDMDQLRDKLRDLANGSPTSNDLTGMVRQADLLMADLHQEIPEMSVQEQQQALGKMADIMGEMSQVVQAYARQLPPSSTSGAVMTATPSGSTPGTSTPTGTLQGTPGAVSSAEQMMRDIDQMRDQMMRLWMDQPTTADMVSLLDGMQSVLSEMQLQVTSLSSSEMQSLSGDMSQAMLDMTRTMDTYLRQQVVPTATMTPSPAAPVGTATPIATVAP